MQVGYAYNPNQEIPTSQKKTENTISKESFGAIQFLRPSIERGTLDLKHNNRIPVGFSYYPTELQSLGILRKQDLRISVLDQDINRCKSVSILLFPFHYYW